jgi:glycosyltransferase involved in cell wall biosynthesis
MKKHITHIITGLSADGAEMMLYKLLSASYNGPFSFSVISLTCMEPIGRKIQALGIPVTALEMRRGFPDPRALVKLAISLRRKQPQLVQTWMYHADLIGGVAARIAGAIPVIWNIRHSDLHKKKNKRSTILTSSICAKLSGRLPVRIICCAETSKKIHVRLGYDSEKIVVIPNGFEVEKFRPDLSLRYAIRQELNLPPETRLIGMIARFHPQKDHRNFVNATVALRSYQPEVHYLLCGEKIEWENSELAHWIREADMQDSFHLLGQRADISRIMASLDIATLSSSGEGFPNVIGEAMACGVPCVATNVGDSAYIVGDTGIIVPPRDPNALAQAWEKLLSLSLEERIQFGNKARKRIMDNFDLQSVAKKYEDLWMSVIRS